MKDRLPKRLVKLLQLFSTPFPSVLRVLLYRWLGAEIEEGARLSPLAIVIAERIHLGPMAKIRPFTIVNGPRELRLGAYAGISNFTILNGPGRFVLGAMSQVGIFVFVDLHDDVVIGEWTGIGPCTSMMTHGLYWPTSWGYFRRWAPITIGDFVWLSNNCKIGPGVDIDSRVLVMPNSAVSAPIKGSQMVYDSSVKRTKVPFDMLQKPPTRGEVQALVRRLVLEFAQRRLEPKGFRVQERGNLLLLDKGKRLIVVHLFAMERRWLEGAEEWLVGFDLGDDVLSETSDLCRLDIRGLVHSTGATRTFHALLDFARYSYGIRAVDVRFRDRFRYRAPAFATERPAEAEVPESAPMPLEVPPASRPVDPSPSP